MSRSRKAHIGVAFSGIVVCLGAYGCNTPPQAPARVASVVQLAAGPYKTVDIGDGKTAPLYLVPFDKNGICEAPATRAHLIESVRSGDFTDIFIFSHGWNNDWADATAHYDDFFLKYRDMRQRHGLKYDRDYRPIFVGIIWPSAALVWDSERGPAMAALGSQPRSDRDVDQERRELASVAVAVPLAQAPRFYELAQKDRLTDPEGEELAAILLPIYSGDHDELIAKAETASAKELMSLWRELGGGRNATEGGSSTSSLVSGLPSARDIIRLATVWQMKGRAGTVGARGVGPLLDEMLAGRGRVHLVGHSYGCKVVLSALCFTAKQRPVNSVLLLQPAISALCFASDVDGRRHPGGYRNAFDGRIEQPILTTFSKNDVPLTRVFQWALRRSTDIGERLIAEAVSPYAALGGFGPQRLGNESRIVTMKSAGDRYDLQVGTVKVYGLNGDAAIGGHGDVSNETTCWALYSQVAN